MATQVLRQRTTSRQDSAVAAVPAKGEDFAYTAHAYNLEGVSYDSNIVFVGYNTAVNAPEAETAVDANTPVVVYNLSGSVVARGTVGNMPTMPKGVLIVKTGDKAQKVVVK